MVSALVLIFAVKINEHVNVLCGVSGVQTINTKSSIEKCVLVRNSRFFKNHLIKVKCFASLCFEVQDLIMSLCVMVTEMDVHICGQSTEKVI